MRTYKLLSKGSFLTVIFFLYGLITASAVNPAPGGNGSGSGSDSKDEYVIIRKSKPLSGRPLAPSNQYLVMVYDYEKMVCRFELTDAIPHLHVDIVDTVSGAIYSEDVFKDSPEMQQSIGRGSYTITCTDDNGGIYCCAFEID